MEPAIYPALVVSPKTGEECFTSDGQSLDHRLRDFWRWSCSDLVSNATRGVLAEYLVATALGLTEQVRVEWNAFDLCTEDGLRIEVKSAAYLQSWQHRGLSRIGFDIRPTRAWDPSTNEYATEVVRQAEVYVFCLLHHTEKETLDPLKVDQWEFYILPARILDEQCPQQKRISLTRLLQLGPTCASYRELRQALHDLAEAERMRP